jgi:hypothetical protein
LVIESAPPVFKLEAVIEPLPAILTDRLADADTLFNVTSLYWSPVKLNAPVVTTPVTATLPLPVPVPNPIVTAPLADIPLSVTDPEAACACVNVTEDVDEMIPALNAA